VFFRVPSRCRSRRSTSGAAPVLNTPWWRPRTCPSPGARDPIDEPGRGETVTIGIRSLRADRFALYGIDPVRTARRPSTSRSTPPEFAEHGLLFDEDELTRRCPADRCLGLWRDLPGDEPPLREKAAREAVTFEDLAEEATERRAARQHTMTREITTSFPAAFLRQRLEPGRPSIEDTRWREVARGGHRGDRARCRSRSSAASAAYARWWVAAATAAAGRAGAALGRLRLVRRVRDGLRKRSDPAPVRRV
jgi:hypothetical protein